MNRDAFAKAEALFAPRAPRAAVDNAVAAQIARCPVCQQHPATKTSATWAYRGSACSEECGQKASRAIRTLHRSLKWRRAEAKRDAVLRDMRDMEAKAVLDSGGL